MYFLLTLNPGGESRRQALAGGGGGGTDFQKDSTISYLNSNERRQENKEVLHLKNVKGLNGSFCS